MTGVTLIDVVLIAAAVLVALATIWRKGIRPLWRGGKRLHDGVEKITEAAPVLFAIAEDWKVNGGGSLRDKIERIEKVQAQDAVDRVAAAEELAVKVAAAAAEIQVSHEALVGKVDALTAVFTQHVKDDTAAFARVEAHQAAQTHAATAAHEAAVQVLHEETGELGPGPWPIPGC